MGMGPRSTVTSVHHQTTCKHGVQKALPGRGGTSSRGGTSGRGGTSSKGGNSSKGDSQWKDQQVQAHQSSIKGGRLGQHNPDFSSNYHLSRKEQWL